MSLFKKSNGNFVKIVYTPAGQDDATMAIAACRAGGIGVLNAEFSINTEKLINQIEFLSTKVSTPFGLKLENIGKELKDAIEAHAQKGLGCLIVDEDSFPGNKAWIAQIRGRNVAVLMETFSLCMPRYDFRELIDGVVVKGNESGGIVGENSSFIMAQKWCRQTNLPVFVRGGMSPHFAAACGAVGVAGGVFDSQVLLLHDSALAETLLPIIGNLTGSETIAVGSIEKGEYLRFLIRPNFLTAQRIKSHADGKDAASLKSTLKELVNWNAPMDGILPIGQDVCFSGLWRRQYGNTANLFDAIDCAVENSLKIAVAHKPLGRNSALAEALNVQLPVVQGPMARISDNIGFATSVAKAGGLPVIALALSDGDALDPILSQAAKEIKNGAWGVGVMGFAPKKLFDEQLSVISKYKPRFAVIAGGKPEQTKQLEKIGVTAFLHVPTPELLPIFLKAGARRFIFEGRECGGHVGPLGSAILWSRIVDGLVAELRNESIVPSDIQVLFAGGIHDAKSAAMVQVIAAPLVEKGVKIGIQMGTIYLFTREIVNSGALQRLFQEKAIDCSHTVCLQAGPGHASRCAYTPFALTFNQKRMELSGGNVSVSQCRDELDRLSMGRLLVASKGLAFKNEIGSTQSVDRCYQEKEGMYMMGQVATLQKAPLDIAALHQRVSEKSVQLLREALIKKGEKKNALAKPVDIAIIGMSVHLPKADSLDTYWENIIYKVNAFGEIPTDRWDWRIYFDENRKAKDKIYSRWGGFMDDMIIDPTKFGIPPKSLAAVDPMQIMALNVAWRALVDAEYESRPFDRARTSVIIGCSGGVGDVGMQYGLRTELPRFAGELPNSLKKKLPEWTEDTFAGILPNVVAGRIANRLNLRGANFTTDAACASSMAALYQAINELTSGRSNMVIAGGVDTSQGPFGYMCFSQTQALSPTGQCKTFNCDADGIVISEGIAMVVLKRLRDAQREGDRIYAVIKGVGASSDGRVKGLTAPEPEGQLQAMRQAYGQAGFNPNAVTLIEAHGTGTVSGDNAELESTTRLLKEAGCGKHHACIGSVKTLIGHTKATAGVAGLVKGALSLYHRLLPPHYPADNPSPIFKDESSPLFLSDRAMPWITYNKRRASVSAFGFGGTNFHLVMEEYSDEYRSWRPRPAASNNWPAELFLWRGQDRDRLSEQLIQLKHGLAKAPCLPVRHIAYTLAEQLCPSGLPLAIVASGRVDLQNKIDAALAFLKESPRQNQKLLPGIYFDAPSNSCHGKLAVLFAGQGSQYPNMFCELAMYFPIVQEYLEKADALLQGDFKKRFGENVCLSRFIYPRGIYDRQTMEKAKREIMRTDVAQPALGAVGAGLWAIMHDLEMLPDMFAGHSYGELTALYAAGWMDFDALMSLSEARGRVIVDAVAKSDGGLGTMAAVNGNRDEVQKIISGVSDLVLANHNAPRQCVISGSQSAIREGIGRLDARKIASRHIEVAAGFHSPLMYPAEQAFKKAIESMKWLEKESQTVVYSNTTAVRHSPDSQEIKRTLIDHLVQPVEFVQQINNMYKDGARVFLELGPKSVLTGLVRQILADHPHTAIALNEQNNNSLGSFLGGCGQLICAGVPLNIKRLFAGRYCHTVDLPALVNERSGRSVPKSAWILNGSGVRHIAEASKNVGINKHIGPDKILGTTQIKENQSFGERKPTEKKGSNMTMREERGIAARHGTRFRRVFPENGTTVMAQYFDTMRMFLLTQEQVMTHYFGATPGENERQDQVLLSNRGIPAYPALMAVSDAPPMEKMQVKSPSGVALGDSHDDSRDLSDEKATAAEPKDKGIAEGSQDPEQLLDKDALTKILLTVVEDKTGYPKDMLDINQNMEAELGIDSIKRVEITSAFLESLPQSFMKLLNGEQEQLSKQTTLNEMVTMLIELQSKIDPESQKHGERPFNSAGVESKKRRFLLPLRYIVKAAMEPIDENAARRFSPGTFILTAGHKDLVAKLKEVLQEKDCTVLIADRTVLENDENINRWCEDILKKHDGIDGIVHLSQVGAQWFEKDTDLAQWKEQLVINERSLFLLLQQFNDRLRDGASITSVSSMGGYFGRDDKPSSGLSIQGGSVGLLKSFFQERPSLKVKAIDVDLNQSSLAIAEAIFHEIEFCGGRQEVGYPDGIRTIFKTTAADLNGGEEKSAILKDLVVLATGGARGVTAETLRELATQGNTLLLAGRSPLPEEEPESLQSLPDANALRRHFINHVRDGKIQLSMAQIEFEIRKVLSKREMRLNIDDFKRRGATIDYYQVDVTDEKAMRRMIDSIYDRYGKIDGVVHGAGIIEDKLLVDKDIGSWSRVVETKVLGLLLLQKYLRPETLRFLSVFSSVAGRYGNSGQTDYATANELMNRLCCQLRNDWNHQEGSKKIIKSYCWGPWGRTRFGTGMVNEFTEAKFGEKGVSLITPETGRQLFREELMQSESSEVETICGNGPWEEQEAQNAQLSGNSPPGKLECIGPLLRNAGMIGRHDDGDEKIVIRLSDSMAYLDQHRIGHVSILPMAVAVEMMAEAVTSFSPGWEVVEALDLQLLKGVEVKPEKDLELEIIVGKPVDIQNGARIERDVAIASQIGNDVKRKNYRGKLRLAKKIPQGELQKLKNHSMKSLTIEKAYGDWLFHGPIFQVIEKIDGLSDKGAKATVKSSIPKEWARGANGNHAWVIDPGIVDAAGQMAILWSRAFRNETSLPVYIGRISRYRETLPKKLNMHFECETSNDSHMVKADISYSDADHNVVLLIESMLSASSPEMNRVVGKKRTEGPAAAKERDI